MSQLNMKIYKSIKIFVILEQSLKTVDLAKPLYCSKTYYKYRKIFFKENFSKFSFQNSVPKTGFKESKMKGNSSYVITDY